MQNRTRKQKTQHICLLAKTHVCVGHNIDVKTRISETKGQTFLCLSGSKNEMFGIVKKVFEFPKFEGGTRALSLAIAASDGFSLAGGGDTLAAIDQFAVADRISYISTGGGAFLEFVEGKELPAVRMLKSRGGS